MKSGNLLFAILSERDSHTSKIYATKTGRDPHFSFRK